MSELRRNAFKAALAEGRRQIGLWTMLPDPYVTEVLADTGFDWLLIDTEHSPNDLRTVMGQLQAAKAAKASVVVRVRAMETALIKQYLDVGAQTILVPMVNSAAEARAAVAAVRYPPAGIRGLAGATRASDFGRVPGFAKRANAEVGLVVQVETVAAVAAIEEIAAVEGVDGIFVGPGDLAASLGYPGEPAHPEVMKVVEAAIGRIGAAGKPAGFLTANEEIARQVLGWGAVFVAVGIDLTMLMQGATALAGRFKG
jgi:4-hydroxy-2-oxoheptanedioate aldolase